MTTMRQVLFCAWIAFAFLDAVGGFVGWIELRKDFQRSSQRLAPVLFAGAYRSVTTILGLYLFGMNINAPVWFLCVGLSAVIYKAQATWGWLFYLHGVINGGGWAGIFRRDTISKGDRHN